MKSTIAVFLIATTGLISLSIQAAPVTIDFDEVTPSTSSGSATQVESKGYQFLARTDFLIGGGETGVSSSGIYAFGENAVAGFCENNCQAEIVMERSDGGAFAVFALDAESYSGFGAFFGTLASGGTVELAFADIGTGNWLNLTRLSYLDDFEFSYDKYVRMDNIVVSAVPVPAAVWLFGSALAALGWIRRRRPAISKHSV